MYSFCDSPYPRGAQIVHTGKEVPHTKVPVRGFNGNRTLTDFGFEVRTGKTLFSLRPQLVPQVFLGGRPAQAQACQEVRRAIWLVSMKTFERAP